MASNPFKCQQYPRSFNWNSSLFGHMDCAHRARLFDLALVPRPYATNCHHTNELGSGNWFFSSCDVEAGSMNTRVFFRALSVFCTWMDIRSCYSFCSKLPWTLKVLFGLVGDERFEPWLKVLKRTNTRGSRHWRYSQLYLKEDRSTCVYVDTPIVT